MCYKRQIAPCICLCILIIPLCFFSYAIYQISIGWTWDATWEYVAVNQTTNAYKISNCRLQFIRTPNIQDCTHYVTSPYIVFNTTCQQPIAGPPPGFLMCQYVYAYKSNYTIIFEFKAAKPEFTRRIGTICQGSLDQVYSCRQNMMKQVKTRQIFFHEWFSKGYHGLEWDYADQIKFKSLNDILAYIICGIGIYFTLLAIMHVCSPSEDEMRTNAQEQAQEMFSSQA